MEDKLFDIPMQENIFKPRHNKAVYKPYSTSTEYLLPPSIDISEIEKMYKGGGAPAYHPRMMLKSIVTRLSTKNLYK